MIKDHYDQIRRNKTAFWWFAARRDFFSRILQKFGPGSAGTCLDLGCGPLTNEVLYERFGLEWLALDNSPESFKGLSRGGGFLPVLSNVRPLPLKDRSVSLSLLLDVLEHLEDEEAVLDEIRRTLVPGGHLLVSVPAFRVLWSRHDEQAGHKRRYLGKELEALLRGRGFEVVYSSYFNLSLFLPILLARQALKLLPAGKRVIEADLSPGFLDGILYALLRAECYAAMNFFRLPFGTSFVALARRKDG